MLFFPSSSFKQNFFNILYYLGVLASYQPEALAEDNTDLGAVPPIQEGEEPSTSQGLSDHRKFKSKEEQNLFTYN